MSNRADLAAASPVSWLWGRALDFVFPPRCAGCGALGSFICQSCRASMSKAEPPRCDVCWVPVLSGVEGPVLSGVEGQKIVDVCARCRHSLPAFQAARAAFVYEGAARQAVHALKYHGVSALAGGMARGRAGRLLP